MVGKPALENKIDALTKIVEKGFAAVAEDISAMKDDMSEMKVDMSAMKGEMFGFKKDMSKLATKEDLAALHIQVNSIETHIRSMRHVKLEGRVADLEEKVFGNVRG